MVLNENYVIVKGKNATISESTAAKELCEYLNLIGGIKLPIVTDAINEIDTEIVIGHTNRYQCEYNNLGDEGFIIKSVGKKLIITGGEQRGTLYGVYTFLEEQLDCRWFAPDLKVIPEMKNIFVDDSLNNKQVPVFENRDVYWYSAFDEDWSVKQKQNGLTSRKISDEFGGGVSYAKHLVHSFNNLVQPEIYFESHPEYYSLNAEGIRETSQLCLTNSDVLKITIESVRKLLAENPNANIVTVSQNDCFGYCLCDKCKAIDEIEGSPSGTMIHFVNSVADAIKDEFPKVAVDTLAYQYTRKAPYITQPRENVIVRLCSIECCFSHPLQLCDKSASTWNIDLKTFVEDIKDWKKICNRLYIWDYTTDFSHYLTPFPNMKVLAPNIQFFGENNVKGMFEQGNYQSISGEFGELRSYLLAKLLWNPYTNIGKHMTEFLHAYYGDGYEYISEYIDFTSIKAEEIHMGIFMTPTQILQLTDEEIKKCEMMWDKAELGTKDDKQLLHIKRSRLQLEYYKSVCGKLSFDKNSELYKAIKSFGITHLTEYTTITENPDFNKTANNW